MYCPFCRHPDSRVIDSRTADDGAAIRRRRSCPECGRRFTTQETVILMVAKRSGVTEPFNRDKIIHGVQRACQGRPVNEDKLAILAQQVEETIRARGLASSPRTRLAWPSSARCGTSTRWPTSGSPRSTGVSSRSPTSRTRSPRCARDAAAGPRRSARGPRAQSIARTQRTHRPDTADGIRRVPEGGSMTETASNAGPKTRQPRPTGAAASTAQAGARGPSARAHHRADLHHARRAPLRRGHLGAPRRRHDQLA